MLLPLLRAAKIIRIFSARGAFFGPNAEKAQTREIIIPSTPAKVNTTPRLSRKFLYFRSRLAAFVAEGAGRDDYTLFAGEEKKSVRAAALVSASAIKGIRVV